MNIEGPVVVSRRGEARVEAGHPWVYRSDLLKEVGASPGAVVRVEGPRGRPLGFAFYSSRSEIRLRMLFGASCAVVRSTVAVSSR